MSKRQKILSLVWLFTQKSHPPQRLPVPLKWNILSWGINWMNQTQIWGCCFSLAMPSYENTFTLFISTARPETPVPSQPGAPGRRHAATMVWLGWMRQRVFDRGWVDGMKEGSLESLFPFHTIWNLPVSDANKVVEAKSENKGKHEGKSRLKRGMGGEEAS